MRHTNEQAPSVTCLLTNQRRNLPLYTEGACPRCPRPIVAAFKLMVSVSIKLFLLLPAAARGWTSCLYPHVDWLAVDQGDAENSGGGVVAGMGSNAYFGGYSMGVC